jgi:two-component system, chemotaxis family, chemotaxis protein CheY
VDALALDATCELRLAVPPREIPCAAVHEHASPDASYILVVEDDADLRQLHAEVLVDAGLPVREAADGLEGLEIMEAHGVPAVVVLDLRMPRMNGWDFAERLRARPEWRDIAIVVVAAHYQIREEATALGASAWLHKPVSIDDLARVVGRAYRDAVTSKAS